MHLPNLRNRQRGREDALPQPGAGRIRLDVNDHIDSGEGIVKRLLETVGGRMTLADRGAGRDADDDVGEVLPPSPTKPEPA